MKNFILGILFAYWAARFDTDKFVRDVVNAFNDGLSGGQNRKPHIEGKIITQNKIGFR